ncbi:unnamed protein product [Ceutorhynchus assimilis]|uniref:Deltamethrin resistance protein prag01 domain-containing protein n=1 Tax=Ceutorhynchus assimilis TaxID=467358 RepID=A0A9N9MQ12_9CUCU|nr:unnamed protein product [Ceutorhynchus assimilis]
MHVPQRAVQVLARQALQKRSYHSSLTTSTYNDLPSPAGSWQTQFESQQRKYNTILAAGLAVFAGSLLVGKASGMFEFYNHYPDRPATIETYKP